ncbi:RsfA family transcriptional regulator [Virgibacillus sp. 179-BFC.A HS]|uniref:RsfA family transcriptional regulator n=1 Tax=Tigheibacillus jepli TaxID=3035914 RepID=A0ABU5CGM9_9BACI|nr:RsfA family transcriptional regulator [Virgibacillus sp. 179-BFC.A HS]MDY0405487.1 RsfA family transcriptional regulator [Virgibacillus sp. 179-BFC.A HS]
MAKVRQDAWSHEDDLLLAETVLRHIREGSTQLNAFEEVGDALNRTSAACGFRWNAEIRKKYVDAIEIAKRQRKEKKRAEQKANKKQTRQPVISLPAPQESTISNEEPVITFDTVIQFLRQVQQNYHASNQSKTQLDYMEKENNKLKKQNEELQKELQRTKSQMAAIQEDYQVFIQIMDRARKMTVLEDDGNTRAPMFRMDKNGNLEQLAQSSGQ